MTIVAPVRLLLTALLVATAMADARAETLGRRSLAGRLLVATDTMGDARFARTVIYVVEHDAYGALGLIVNRPLAAVPFGRVLRSYGLEAPPDSGGVRVHYGGPVGEAHASVLHTPEWRGPGTVAVGDGLAFTADPAVLEAMARGAGPRRALVCLGRATWARGQLDAELRTGAWAVARATERLVFEEEPTQKWIEAMTRRLLEL
jgi:putative transcriptional regulator